MSITRGIRTPIMHRAVEANGSVFLGGTIADDTSVSMATRPAISSARSPAI